jgi:hypothetical protein
MDPEVVANFILGEGAVLTGLQHHFFARLLERREQLVLLCWASFHLEALVTGSIYPVVIVDGAEESGHGTLSPPGKRPNAATSLLGSAHTTRRDGTVHGGGAQRTSACAICKDLPFLRLLSAWGLGRHIHRILSK